MESGQIFGSNITLPSLPGLQSNCEEEILLLMKEIDLEFQRRHHELLTELINVRSLCRAQRDEIENLRCTLQSGNENYTILFQTIQKDSLKEKIKEYSIEVEKLKKENNELQTENSVLKIRVRKLPESEIQLESLKRSLSIQQDENKVLRDRLSKVEEKHQSLQNSYKQVVNGLASFSQNDGSDGRRRISDFPVANEEISQTTEKFLLEEKEFCDVFLSKMSQDIDDFERRLQKEVS